MVDTLQGWHTLGTLTKDGTERPQLWRQTGRVLLCMTLGNTGLL